MAALYAEISIKRQQMRNAHFPAVPRKTRKNHEERSTKMRGQKEIYHEPLEGHERKKAAPGQGFGRLREENLTTKAHEGARRKEVFSSPWRSI
jgi:hypothetical protein